MILLFKFVIPDLGPEDPETNIITRAFSCLKKGKIMNLEIAGHSNNYNSGKEPGVLIMGAKVNLLPSEHISSYAVQVSEQLNSPWTKPKTPEEIEIAIRKARSVICLSSDYEKVLAFAKIEQYGVNDAKQIIYEFGSWIGGNGCGRAVYEGARDLAAEDFPFARLIAFVRSGNIKAQRIITETGGVKVGHAPEGKHIYDITRRQQPTEVIKISPGGIWTIERNQRHIV